MCLCVYMCAYVCECAPEEDFECREHHSVLLRVPNLAGSHDFVAAFGVGPPLLCCSMLQYVAVCRSVLRCVAVCYSVFQCVVLSLSVVQCGAVFRCAPRICRADC